MSRNVRLTLALLLILAAAVRLPGIGRPLLGGFATKNAVYAMIARNWARGHADLWHPTVDCLVSGRRSLHLLEAPLAAYLAGGCWAVLGGSLDAWGRLIAIAFSVASVGLIFVLVRRWHGDTAGLAAAAMLALSPVSVIYGQSFMLESSLVFFTLATLWALGRWKSSGNRIWLPAGGAAFCLLLLTKSYMLVLLLPLAAIIWGRRESVESIPTRPIRRSDRLAATAVVGAAVIPAAVWFGYVAAATAPGGALAERVYYSLRQSAHVHGWPHPLLGSPDFYRQLLDDLSGVALTPLGFALVLAGLLHPHGRRHWPWLAAMAVLVLALPLKFYRMNYYHLAALPPLCVLAGLGWQLIYDHLRPTKTAVAALALLAVLFSLRYAARPAFHTPAEDRGVMAAAAAVRELAKENEPVVTVHGTTIDLLYYCDRPGWALSPQDAQQRATLRECRRQGARYLAVAGWSRLDRAAKDGFGALTEIRRGEDFRMFQLGLVSKLTAADKSAGTR